MARGDSTDVQIEGQTLRLTNLRKVLYPKVGFTKAQVIDYYVRVAPVLLPHLRGRPLTLKRYPNGVEGEFFYEKNCPKHRPAWVQTVGVWSDQNERVMQFCLAQDVPTLVWAANLADLELHVPLARAASYDTPDLLVFDLDPGAPASIVECSEVGLRLHELFATLGVESFAKTSGSKGLQIYVPLNTPVTYDDTKPFARAVAELLEQQTPDKVVSNMKKSLRVGKVLVDWSQNDPHKTTVCVWSLRAKERPTVSTPVTWDEVRRCAEARDAALLTFDSEAALARAAKGDLFAKLLTLRQELPELHGSGKRGLRTSRSRAIRLPRGRGR